jgi:multidrug efflux pump subunit AcrB
MNFYRKLVSNHPLANIAFLVVLIVGMAAYAAMPREQDPEINFNWVSIVAALPGASPEDVAKRVTKPLEEAIKGVADIRWVISSSREGSASILVRFYDVSDRVFDKRINDLRREIQNKAKSELPPEAKDPMVLEITTSNGFPTAMVMLTATSVDENFRLRAARLKSDLERINGVDQVFATGLRDPELRVNFDAQALASRAMTGADLADSVSGWFRDTFGGRIESGEGDARTGWLVRVIGQQPEPDYLASLSVASPANPRAQVPIDSVATVERGRALSGSQAASDGQAAVIFSVTKKSGINTIELVDRLNAYIAAQSPLLAQSGLKFTLLDDQTTATREAIGVMERNALQGLLFVLLICWVFLGWRIAVMVGIGIPFSLAGTFIILNATGNTINVSVLLALVIALGMLVDDAVVIVEAIYYRMQRGEAALDASVNAVREVGTPVLASVATTMSAFLPLMLLPGILGKFMFVIPFVVTLALAISLIEAFWMIPAHLSVLNPDIRKRSRTQQMRERFTHWLQIKYGRGLAWFMRRTVLSVVIMSGVIVLAVGLVASGAVRTQFFAFDPLRLFYVNVHLPPGASPETTLAQVQRLEAKVRTHLKEGEARGIASYTGVMFTETEPLYGDGYGQVSVSLNPRGSNGREVVDIVESMRQDIESTPGPGRISFTMISGGPPSAKPVKVRVRADDPEVLRRAADDLLAIVKAVPGTRDATDDDVPGRPQLRLELDREAVRAAGLNPAQVARLIRLHADGEIVAVMRDNGEKVEVRVRARHSSAGDGSNVGPDVLAFLDDPVALPGGGSTTLRALVKPETGPGIGVIRHYNLRRAITVEADLDKAKADTVGVNRQIKAAWEEIATRYPDADIDFSGELDDINESLQSMGMLFLIGVGLIYLILAAQFRSYWQPFMILMTVPLAFTGVSFGLFLSNNPISLYTLYGVIALTGIAVNSAIVLIDAANDRRQRGMSTLHAAMYAARRRLVPIIITSATTIGGLFSLAVGLGGKSLLWGPVAGAIVWGLGFSTVLTLFVVPLLYLIFMRRRSERKPRQARWFRFRRKATSLR